MFRTEVEVPNADINLSLHDQVVTIGSCFAEVIGSKLQQNKVDALVNPFGTIFNPVSVCLLLKAAAGEPYAFEQHLLQQNDIWYSYDLHSSISSPHKEELLQQIQQSINLTHNHLQKASLLIITFGTAVAYRLAPSGNVVANCHKLPAKKFSRELLSQEEILQAFKEMYSFLKQLNPQLKVLLTVSPVRHTKETMLVNSVSKSLLRVVCHLLQESYSDVLYFPAYEVMLDDLRDYRYYKDDLIHPTSMAEAYIWQKFVNAYYNEQFQSFMKEWEKVEKALQHKPFHPGSDSHQKFLLKTQAQLEQIAHKYKIDISQESGLLLQQQKLR